MACLINLLNNGVDGVYGVDGVDGVNGVFDNLPYYFIRGTKTQIDRLGKVHRLSDYYSE